MGTRYELLTPTLKEAPGEVEGFKHWIRYDDKKEAVEFGIIVDFWAGIGSQVLLGTLDVRVTPYVVEKYGGVRADWETLLATGEDSDDTDDVIELLATTPAWGNALLWSMWRKFEALD